jgi:hypothetical protein
MDVHRGFCEVAIADGGAVRAAGQILTTPAALELFACRLAPTDEVAIEATDEAARARRRLISRRSALVRQCTREKNQVHAALQSNLVDRPPMSDLFGVKGRVAVAASRALAA